MEEGPTFIGLAILRGTIDTQGVEVVELTYAQGSPRDGQNEGETQV